MLSADKPKLRVSRELILDAAIKLLLARSSDTISMAMVAAVAGVSRRTVFNQFSSKESLYEAAMQRVWTKIPMLEITRDANALREPNETPRKVGMAIMEFWLPKDAIDTARMIIRESTRYPKLSETYVEKRKKPTLQAFSRTWSASKRLGCSIFTIPTWLRDNSWDLSVSRLSFIAYSA